MVYDHFMTYGHVRPTAAMIFGKKPELRGTGDREGERGNVQRPARAGRGVRFGKKPCGETRMEPACQGGADLGPFEVVV
jgi:hypothetical protein